MRYKILRKVIFLLFLFLYTASASEARLTPLDLPQFSKIYSNILNQLIDDVLISETNFVRASFLPIQERNVSNAVTREYVWGLNLGGGIGGLLNLKQNGNDYSYLYDGRGNVTSLINGAQAVVASYRYDPFGVLMKKTASIDQPYMFSTKPYDEKLGLLRYEYRLYSPEIGKWISRDPLWEEGDFNLYRFNKNSAMNWIDPLGLASCTYSISSHALICVSNSGGNPITLGPSGVFSGVGECKNNPACIDDKYVGPIRTGNYKMNKDDRPAHENFWRLEPIPKIPWWKCMLGARCGFELHPGRMSLGCITADKNKPKTMSQYDQINDLLNKEIGNNKLKVVP